MIHRASEVTAVGHNVVRQIIARAAASDGLKTIAKALNAAHAPAPRSQQGWRVSRADSICARRDQRRYRLTVPIAFDRMVVAVVLELQGFHKERWRPQRVSLAASAGHWKSSVTPIYA